MYDRFDDDARRVMRLANQSAGELKQEYIHPENVLVGLLSAGMTTACQVLLNLHVDPRDLLEKLQMSTQIWPRPEEETATKLPQTHQTKQVNEYATEESRSLHHNYVGTEHILLGLLRAERTEMEKLLTASGLTLERTRDEVKYVLGMKEKPIRQIGTDAYLLHADDDSANRMQKLTQLLQELDRTMDIKYIVVTGTRKA